MKKVILFFLFIVAVLNAQERLDFSAQIRPRFIIDNRDFNSNTGFHSFGEMRTRVGLSFIPNENVSAFFQIQDSRTFGEEPGTISNLKNLDLHQAYFQVNNIFELPVNLKAGRMEASYGTERIMARNNWNNIGRSFDGITLQIDLSMKCDFKLDLFAFRVAESGLPEDSLDENVLGAFAELGFIKGHKLQPFVVYYTSTSPAYPFNVYSPGVYLTGNIERFEHQAEFICQFNAGNEDIDTDLSAYMIGYNATYNFQSGVKPFLSTGIDYFSGNDGTGDEYNEFSRLFGAGHKYLGYMDYFPKNTFGFGIMDMHIKAGMKPVDKLSLKTALHIFNSAEEAGLSSGTTSNSFGTEIDLVVNYKYNSYVTFEGGAGLFLPGEIFKERIGEDNSTWFYLMGIFDF